MARFAPTARRFDHEHVDLVGPLPPSQNHRYLFTVVDRFTRWAEAIPLVDAQTTTCARAFAAHWVARFGVPPDMTSDRGSKFTSELWSVLSQLHGTRLHRTSAYHPQSQIRTDGSSRWIKLARRTVMGPARHPHCAQRRYRVFISRAGIRSATDSPGRFRLSWAGDSGCSTVPSATPRDSSRPGTDTFNPARHRAVNSGTQRLCLCAPRQPPSTLHTAVRWALQGLDARREVVRANYGNRHAPPSLPPPPPPPPPRPPPPLPRAVQLPYTHDLAARSDVPNAMPRVTGARGVV